MEGTFYFIRGPWVFSFIIIGYFLGDGLVSHFNIESFGMTMACGLGSIVVCAVISTLTFKIADAISMVVLVILMEAGVFGAGILIFIGILIGIIIFLISLL